MNKFYLVKFSLNYNDEFDIRAVSVCDSIRLEHEKAIVASNADYCFDEVYFGTNECFYALNIHNLFEAYTFIEISESTYNELKHHLILPHGEGYGTWFSWPSSLLDDYNISEYFE